MRQVAYFLMAIISVVLCSCEHKDLCFHHPHTRTLKIVYDWEQAPNADPYGMCVFVYPENGGEPLRFDFDNRNSGDITLNNGKYKLLTYNNDTDGVLFGNIYSFEGHSLYTREGSVLEPIYGNAANYAPRAEGTEEERVVITPDMMWGCTAVDVVIDGNNISYTPLVLDNKGELVKSETVKTTGNVITFKPHELMNVYTYEVRNVKNLKRMQQMCATISGMAGVMTVADEKVGNECFTIPFESFRKDDDTVIGKFITFGHNKSSSKPHKMAFYVIMDDGNKYVYKDSEKYDVTNQVNTAPNRRRVHIIIDGLELPTPITNGTGLAPSVDDWIEENTEIIL